LLEGQLHGGAGLEDVGADALREAFEEVDELSGVALSWQGIVDVG